LADANKIADISR